MTSATVHRRRVSETISPLLGIERKPIGDLLAVPRTLAADVVSAVDVPGFDNSSMDGYAVAAATLEAAEHSGEEFGPLPVVGQIAAGSRGSAVPPGAVVEIMTGAPLPAGTDTIVPIEATTPGRFGAAEVSIAAAETVETGAYVRPRGSDVTEGATVLTAGDLLTPARLGAAAACGITALDVHALPSVLVLSTGDEVAAGAEAGIHDANGVTLTASLLRLGAEATTLCVPDDPRRLLDAVAASPAALVISTGGISQGAREVVKLAADLDPQATMTFEAIAMQPGGPQGCGTLAGKPWIALPGNPVSALVSFELFIRPALLGLNAEADAREVEYHRLATGFDEAPPAGKLQVRRAVIGDGGIDFVGGSRSHLLHAYAESTHLVFIPPTDPADPEELHSARGDRLKTWKIG